MSGALIGPIGAAQAVPALTARRTSTATEPRQFILFRCPCTACSAPANGVLKFAAAWGKIRGQDKFRFRIPVPISTKALSGLSHAP